MIFSACRGKAFLMFSAWKHIWDIGFQLWDYELEALSLGDWMSYNQKSLKECQGREGASLLLGACARTCATWGLPSSSWVSSYLPGALVALLSPPSPHYKALLERVAAVTPSWSQIPVRKAVPAWQLQHLILTVSISQKSLDPKPIWTERRNPGKTRFEQETRKGKRISVLGNSISWLPAQGSCRFLSEQRLLTFSLNLTLKFNTMKGVRQGLHFLSQFILELIFLAQKLTESLFLCCHKSNRPTNLSKTWILFKCCMQNREHWIAFEKGRFCVTGTNEGTDFPKAFGISPQRLGMAFELSDRLSLPMSTSFSGLVRMLAC